MGKHGDYPDTWDGDSRQSDKKDKNVPTIMPFGKHKGRTLEWLAANEPDYLRWIKENVDLREPLLTHIDAALVLARKKEVEKIQHHGSSHTS